MIGKIRIFFLLLIARYRASKKRNAHLIVESSVPSLRLQYSDKEFLLYRKELVCNFHSDLYLMCNDKQMLSMNILGRTSSPPH